MKTLILSFLSFFTVASAAQAYATATLINCRFTTTRSGQTVYVGTYRAINGRSYQFVFENWCPSIINLDLVN